MTTTATCERQVCALADAGALVELYDERCALAARDNETGAMLDEVLDKGRELDAACEAFRRRHYPRRARVVVGLWTVIVASNTGRRTETVLDLFDQYAARDAERHLERSGRRAETVRETVPQVERCARCGALPDALIHLGNHPINAHNFTEVDDRV